MVPGRAGRRRAGAGPGSTWLLRLPRAAASRCSRSAPPSRRRPRRRCCTTAIPLPVRAGRRAGSATRRPSIAVARTSPACWPQRYDGRPGTLLPAAPRPARLRALAQLRRRGGARGDRPRHRTRLTGPVTAMTPRDHHRTSPRPTTSTSELIALHRDLDRRRERAGQRQAGAAARQPHRRRRPAPHSAFAAARQDVGATAARGAGTRS